MAVPRSAAAVRRLSTFPWQASIFGVHNSMIEIYFALNNNKKKILSNQSLNVNQFSSVQFSSVAQLCPTLRPHRLQHARPPCPSTTPGAYSNPCPLSQWCQPSHPLSSLSPPTLNLSQHQGLFKRVSSSHQVAKVLEFQLQHQSFSEYSGLISWIH